jgi:AP-2 complex subunit mu-1
MGESEYLLSAEVDLSSMVQQKQWSRPPISMDFQVMMFTSSGLSVQYLKVTLRSCWRFDCRQVFEKTNYKSVKWVRYFTKAGSYQFRF